MHNFHYGLSWRRGDGCPNQGVNPFVGISHFSTEISRAHHQALAPGMANQTPTLSLRRGILNPCGAIISQKDTGNPLPNHFPVDTL